MDHIKDIALSFSHLIWRYRDWNLI